MQYKTKISKIVEGDLILRGKKLSEVVKSSSFSDAIFLTMTGREANKAESVLFEKMLISVIDHGMGTVSSMSARFVASGGNELNVGVGAGVLGIGNFHGGAIEKAMMQFYSWQEKLPDIEEIVRERKVLFGFGHKHYKKGDPRVEVLLDEIKKIGFESKHLHLKDKVEQAFEKVKGKKVHINIDGMIALLLCDFKLDPLLGKGVFIAGRVPGLVAQVFEELTQEKPVRRIDEDKIDYVPL